MSICLGVKGKHDAGWKGTREGVRNVCSERWQTA